MAIFAMVVDITRILAPEIKIRNFLTPTVDDQLYIVTVIYSYILYNLSIWLPKYKIAPRILEHEGIWSCLFANVCHRETLSIETLRTQPKEQLVKNNSCGSTSI